MQWPFYLINALCKTGIRHKKICLILHNVSVEPTAKYRNYHIARADPFSMDNVHSFIAASHAPLNDITVAKRLKLSDFFIDVCLFDMAEFQQYTEQI